LREASQIIAMKAHPVVTKPAVAAELGMVVVGAEATGTATEKMEEEEIQRQRRI
jgi:hypothetical protein